MSRPRPPYEPAVIECRNCGASVDVLDERTQLLVCSFCRANLDLTEGEQRVLGIGPPCPIDFRLEIGESLQIRGDRYEVIARIAFIEDDDPEDQSHQYYLYHPRRRPLWLGEYEGTFSLSWRTRARPERDPFLLTRGETFQTYDGGSWRALERGQYEVYYVDGALPFVQSLGDRIEYAEATATDGSGQEYEAQRAEGELEYGRGEEVPAAKLAQWLGRPLRGGASAPVQRHATNFGPLYAVALVGFAALASVALLFFNAYCHRSGTPTLAFRASAAQLGGEPMSEIFVVPRDDCLIRVDLDANVSNAWMYAQVALVEEDGDTVLHVAESEISAYHGYEGGESWSEGGTTDRFYVLVPEAGRYRLMMGGTSGYGDDRSDVARHSLLAQVAVDAFDPSPLFVYGMIGAFVALAFAALCFVLMPMGLSRSYATVAFLVGAVLLVAVDGYGVSRVLARADPPEVEHPDGISIRHSSVGGLHAGFFAIYNSPRGHLGGGVHSGK